MKRVWLTIDDADYANLLEVNETVWRLADVENANLSADEIIVIGAGECAKDRAMDLVSRGVDDAKLSYVDLAKGDDFFARIGKPKHLFWDDVVSIADLDVEEDFPVYPSGIDFLDKNLGWGWRIPELGVLCGPYGCGKSTFGQILALNFVHNAGRQFGSGAMLCSWEDMGEEVKRNVMNFTRTHQARDLPGKVHFVRRKASSERLMSWYISLVRYHRRRFGTRFFYLDPWNEMDHKPGPKQLETDYVKDIMREMRDVVEEEQIIQLIATHIPGKYMRGDGSIEPFKVGNAFGSSNFGNKTDRGLCLVRTKAYEPLRGHSIIRLDKGKVERKMGKRGTVAAWLDSEKFCLNYDGMVTSEVQGIWKD